MSLATPQLFAVRFSLFIDEIFRFAQNDSEKVKSLCLMKTDDQRSPLQKDGFMYNLTDIKTIQAILKKYGFRFSKSLGQNFLTDSEVPIKIAELAQIDEGYGVIEIGPGMGTLTVELAKRAKKVVAVELDSTLLPVLGETLKDFANIQIINNDVLKTDINQIIEEHFKGLKVAICANLPYYITTPVIMYLLESKVKAESLTFMVQKEVALRLCAKPNTADYGAITLAVNFYTKPSLLFNVPATSFTPMPKVESSVIRLELLRQPPVQVENERFLFRVIKAAFSQRRKTLVNSVCNTLGEKIHKEDIFNALQICGLSENIRGEVLSLEDFARFSENIYKNIKK
jgi:16S rRNA (adenine1518-N6/adenine1519-N6)-dimethyltransferase